MKVCLINPPTPFLADDAAYPPSGLMYLASAIENAGHQAEIVDLTGGIDWENLVKNLSADLFGITFVTPNFNMVKKILSTLPPDKPVVLGGPHPTALPEDCLKNLRCNAVVQGEGELAIVELLKDLASGNFKNIYKGGIVPVGKIPKPARHLVNLFKYRPGGEETTPIYTSRGCPFACAFCSKMTGRTYRALPIERVLQEVEEVVKLGYKNLFLSDDNIAIRKQLPELLAALKPYNVRYRLNQDARSLDEEVLKIAAQTGCSEISFGIESGSDKMLKLMNKKATSADNKRALLLAKSYGLKVKAYLVVNFPGEDEATVQETVDFLLETRPDKWLLSSFAPLPGSDSYHHPEKYGINWLSGNWEDYNLVDKDGKSGFCFTTPELTRERQIYLHDLLYNRALQMLGKPVKIREESKK